MTTSKVKKYAVPINDELGSWLSYYAASQDISVAEVIRRALSKYKELIEEKSK